MIVLTVASIMTGYAPNLALVLASAANNNHNWCHKLEYRLLTMLEASFTLKMCLQYSPLLIESNSWLILSGVTFVGVNRPLSQVVNAFEDQPDEEFK